MASRTLRPLRAASLKLQTSANPRNWAQISARTLVSTPGAKPYPPSSTGRRAAPSKLASAYTSSASKDTPPPSSSSTSKIAARTPIPAVSGVALPDAPLTPAPSASASAAGPNSPENGDVIDWSQSYHGLGTSAFPPETATLLQQRLDPDDIEVKPDGIIYLPEIKYRRILNASFGPGGWGLAPRGPLHVEEKLVTREYALVVHGRFVAQARGEQQYFSEDGVSTAAEGCKSNALMRCCKDLGIASELWDPRFIRKFMKQHAVQQWVEHVATRKKKQIWLRKDDEVRYPFKKC
ncbi:hypothetical protein AAE478_007548 [Parahypoxylon ruwenzoriense]